MIVSHWICSGYVLVNGWLCMGYVLAKYCSCYLDLLFVGDIMVSYVLSMCYCWLLLMQEFVFGFVLIMYWLCDG